MENSSNPEIHCNDEAIRRSDRTSQWNTVLDEKAKTKDLDKFLGCLIGGAAGDA